MPGGEGITLDSRYTILDATLGSDQEDYEYLVGATDGATMARVQITPYALQKGDNEYSQVRVSGVRAEDGRNIRSTLETYVTPPLYNEAERIQAAKNISHLAIGLAMLDVREQQ